LKGGVDIPQCSTSSLEVINKCLIEKLLGKYIEFFIKKKPKIFFIKKRYIKLEFCFRNCFNWLIEKLFGKYIELFKWKMNIISIRI